MPPEFFEGIAAAGDAPDGRTRTCSNLGSMEFNLADLFENAVDHFGDREYIVCEGKRRTYAEMEERANRLAHHLAAHGVGPGDHVGIYAYNSVEWVETRVGGVQAARRVRQHQLPLRRGRAPLPVRQRRPVALVFQREFAPRVAGVMDELPLLKHAVVIEDGSGADVSGVDAVAYEDAMASGSPERDFGPRSPDDRYILYTGGTTGMPKGVVWRQEDVFYALGGGLDVVSGTRVDRPEQMAEKGLAAPAPDGQPADRAAHARRHPVGRDGRQLRRQQDRARRQVRPRPGVAPRRARRR